MFSVLGKYNNYLHNNNNSILYSALFNLNCSKVLYIENLIKTYFELM